VNTSSYFIIFNHISSYFMVPVVLQKLKPPDLASLSNMTFPVLAQQSNLFQRKTWIAELHFWREKIPQ
jgi:hypothetical protein